MVTCSNNLPQSAIMSGAFTVGYATDVEGNISYWHRYIDHSQVLFRNDAGILELREDCFFVYGGDTCDRGCGDLQVLKDLISLKETYPTRVHLLMGNRDINKLRFSVALLPQVLSLRPACYWAGPSADIEKNPDFQFNDIVSKVKWIMLHTMGSPYAFEYRREELRRSNKAHDESAVAASFADMVSLQSEGDRGLMLRYLALAEVAVVLGDVMFVHGAVHDFNMGFVPYRRDSAEHCAIGGSQGTMEARGYTVDDARDWCRQLNAFAAAEVCDFRENIAEYTAQLGRDIERRQAAVLRALGVPEASQYSARELAALYESTPYVDPDSGVQCVGIGSLLLHDELSGYLHPQPGSGLLMYGMGMMRNKGSTRSAIYTSYLTNGTPCPCSAEVAQWLRGAHTADVSGVHGADSAGAPVRRLVVGHQPHGDAPLTLNVFGLQVICADTSYSINTQWPESHLHANSGSTAPTTRDTVAGDQWLSYAAYTTATAASTPGGAPVLPGGIGAVPREAESRSPLVITELLFEFPESPLNASSCVSSSSARVHGSLSDGSTYACALSALSQDESASSAASDSDDRVPGIGTKTLNGWFVKLTGVSTPAGGKDQVLLAWSAGYDFKNRLQS